MRKSSGWRLLAGLALATASAGLHAAEPAIAIYKGPTGGCCTEWVDHLRKNGVAVETVDSLDLSRIKAMSGVNLEFASCHTAFVNGYVIEGHVPAAEHHAVMPSPAHRHLRDLGSPTVGREGSTAGTPRAGGLAITRP